MFTPEQEAFYVALGTRIRGAREASGLTQDALASLVSLTRTSITNIEKGRQKLFADTLASIADALKVSPSSLLPELPRNEPIEDKLAGRPADVQAWIRDAVLALNRPSEGE